MKEKIFKYIPIFSVILMFTTFILLLADTFIYPGVVKRYLLFDGYYFAIGSSIITYFYYVYFQKTNLQKYCGKISSIVALLSIPAVVLMSFLEIYYYPNYIFSHYHIDPYSLQIFGLFLIFQFVLYKVYKEQKVYLVKKYKNWIIALFAISFSLFLLGGNLKARWSIIDDHEIVDMLGSDQKMMLWEIPQTISRTEVSSWGSLVRYRPSYYSLRVTESFLWGGSPQLWYATRIVFLAILLFVLVKIIAEEISLLVGFSFAIFVMTSSYWSDVWVRLGPSEMYCALGISIYAYSFYKIIKKGSINDSSLFSWIGIFIGGLISAGSKENFVIFALLSLFLIIRSLLKRQINFKLVFPFLDVLYSFFIALGIVLAIRKTGQDIYMNEITLVNRLHLLVSGFIKTLRDFKILGIFPIALILYFWQFRNIHFKKFIHQSINTIYLLIFLFITYLFQIIFYSGNWPTNSRYDFPGILAKQIFWLTLLAVFLHFIKIFNKKIVIKVYLGIVTSMAIVLIFISYNKGFGSIITSVNNNVLSTRAFTSKLERLSEVTSKYPDLPVILRSRSFWDYEPVYSLIRYFKYLNIKNQIYLDYEDKDITLRLGLEKYLSEDLYKLSKAGFSGEQLFLNPFSKLSVESGCIDYNLSYQAINSDCIDIDKY